MKYKISALAASAFLAVSLAQAQTLIYSPSDSSSSGNAHYGLEVTPTLNQSGTAGFTDLFVDRTETAVGTGHQYFEDFQVGGTDKWIVDHAGTVILGSWNGTPITNSYLANMAADTLKGNNSGSSAAPSDLTASQVKTILSLNNVENTALSTWAGSSNLTTVGTLSSGAVPTSLLTGTINLASTGSGGVTGTLPLNQGGTGQTTANLARNAINKGYVALTDGSSIATDCSTGNVFYVTLGRNRTLSNPTNLAAGATYAWIVTQDATGSRTLAYGSVFAWPNGTAPTLTTTSGAVDIIRAITDGTTVYANAFLNFGIASHGNQTFTSSGYFTVPAGVTSVNVLVVAGGGAGGGPNFGGGGGGGGVIYQTGYSTTPGASITVTIGPGGTGTSTFTSNGADGTDSSFGTLTATHGGGGGSYTNNGVNGGSGGGGGGNAGSTSGGTGTSMQGNAGGATVGVGGGGGGGQAAAGANGGVVAGTGGAGGAGYLYAGNYYGAGGGGASYNTPGGSGGSGVGGNGMEYNAGSPTPATSGATNSGSGGGGCTYSTSPSGSGAAGIVIVSW